MTKKERILNAMNGRTVDRVPVAFYLHFPDQTDNTVAETLQWVKNTRVDLALVATDGFYPLMSDTPLQSIEDWKAFRPYERNHPFIALQVDRCRRIVEALKDDAAVYICGFTPLAYFKHTLGGQTLIMEYWNEYRNDVLQILDVLEETNFILLDELKKTGLDGIMMSLQNCEKWRFTKADYVQYIMPYDKRFVNFVNQNFQNCIGHLCSWETEDSNTCINLDLYREYDLQTVNWGVYQRQSMTMAEGRNYFTKAKAVMGGFDRRTEGVLYQGGKEEIKRFTKNLIQQTGDVGFIISGDCSIYKATPDEHIRWVVEACEEYAAEK